jgi:hypothetical protein
MSAVNPPLSPPYPPPHILLRIPPLIPTRRCVIGEDYPHPIVDHKETSAANVAKMKLAFDAHKKRAAGGGAGGGGKRRKD